MHAPPEQTHFRRTYRNSPIDVVLSKGQEISNHHPYQGFLVTTIPFPLRWAWINLPHLPSVRTPSLAGKNSRIS
ncbi:hypothetical protein TNCT_679421 [Trichonephila clavata]|uniref:Uncharacterized protein n=1 Tax=Trichonephila clavata TaxID=2740835 RepID=A0A8X6LKG0_TRICU|nr:hypothetical protein TNCT_679421 [Trichonephila clavata]